jgi:hypothetical protein
MLFPHYFHSTRSNTAAQHTMWPRIYTCMYCHPEFVFWWGFKALTVGLNVFQLQFQNEFFKSWLWTLKTPHRKEKYQSHSSIPFSGHANEFCPSRLLIQHSSALQISKVQHNLAMWYECKFISLLCGYILVSRKHIMDFVVLIVQRLVSIPQSGKSRFLY